MISNKRIGRHLLFWLVYYAVNLFNELFLSSSFTDNPSLGLIMLAMLSQLLVLIIKVPLVYIVLYIMIPRWFKTNHKSGIVLQGVLVFMLATILHRLVIQQIVWPYVYASSPPDFTILQQTARLAYSLLDLLQVAGIAAAIKLFRMRIQAARKEKLLVQEKLQAEMLHLKSQINPHFLFNSLNTIFSLTRSKSDEAPDAVMRLSSILRHMIYETDQPWTTLGDEVKIIEDYIDLQKLRFGKRAVVSLDKDIETESAQIAPLLLLPLVENAFKHGMSGPQRNAGISIGIRQKGAHFSLLVSNPADASKSSVQDEPGIGLPNIRRQLELQYREYDLSAVVESGLFVVNLWINLDTNEGPELFNR
jgi:sensor histidine kinase YesM